MVNKTLVLSGRRGSQRNGRRNQIYEALVLPEQPMQRARALSRAACHMMQGAAGKGKILTNCPFLSFVSGTTAYNQGFGSKPIHCAVLMRIIKNPFATLSFHMDRRK